MSTETLSAGSAGLSMSLVLRIDLKEDGIKALDQHVNTICKCLVATIPESFYILYFLMSLFSSFPFYDKYMMPTI